MSNTRRIRSNTATGTGINQSSDHVMVDADDDDDELILVFPSGGGNDSNSRNHSWLTPTNNRKPPPPIQLRPRYIPPSTKLQLFSTSSTGSGDDHVIATTTTNNGAHFRLSPSMASRSIREMLHHGGSVGDGNTRSVNSSNQIHRTPLSLMNHHGNHPPQFLCYNNSSSPRLDHTHSHHHHFLRLSDQNHISRSPEKTPITAAIPCLPTIPSPPSADAGDITETPDHHVVHYDPLQGRGFHEDTTGSNVQVTGRSEQSNLEATAGGANRTRTSASQVQQLPITTATLAASLRMRKQQAQLLPSPKLF